MTTPTFETVSYQLTVRIADDRGRPAPDVVVPTLRMVMVGHGMVTPAPALVRRRPGTFAVSGIVDMQGRWRFQVGLADATAEIDSALD